MICHILQFPNVQPASSYRNDRAVECLYAVDHAIKELNALPPELLASLRFQRVDQSIVGINWLLEQYGLKLVEAQVKTENYRASTARADGDAT